MYICRNQYNKTPPPGGPLEGISLSPEARAAAGASSDDFIELR